MDASIPSNLERGLSPESIRALRGALSRAAFARELAVTALTVYRWELPEQKPESRRPRGRVLARLRAFAERQPPAGSRAPQPTAATAATVATLSSHKTAAIGGQGTQLSSTQVVRLDRGDNELLLPVLARLTQGDYKRAETDLLHLLSSGELKTRAAKAMATQALARVCVMARGDGRGAFSMLLPLLSDVEAETLPPDVELAVHISAALVFASADGRLFDPGKAVAHVARAERLLDGYGSAEDRLLLWTAQFAVAFILNDAQLIERVISRSTDVLHGHESPVLRCLALFVLAIEALLTGRTALSVRKLEELVELSAQHQLSLFLARALAHLADATLDEAGDPRQALAFAERARHVAQEGRHALSLQTLTCSWAEGEAYLRMGRFADAENMLCVALEQADELAWTPAMVGISLARLYVLTDRSTELRKLAERCSSYDRGVQRSLTHAQADYARALASYLEGAAPTSLLAAIRHADGLAYAGEGWGFLARNLVLSQLQARVMADDPDAASLALARLERVLDHAPSAWASAQLGYWKGVLACRRGRWHEARKILQAALATCELAGLLPEAALARRLLANLALQEGEPDAQHKLEHSDAELKRLALVLPAVLHPDRLRSDERAPRLAPTRRDGLERLSVPLQRLSVRGMVPALIQRELTLVLAELLPGSGVRLEEIDSQGQALLLQHSGPELLATSESVEFSDGSGRRLRVSVGGAQHDDAHYVLTTLTQVAALCLEVATLRGFAEQRTLAFAGSESAPELPGFVAASAAMRTLKLDLVRLSRSRSTVIVTGESGTGKEVVARAIHDLSARSTQPFVAFNCAAVPRELFEGQLFGYKKGAYTGAHSDQPGVIRSARGGTLFLDEIGELPLDVQPKLLRFLENGEIFPLGERRPVQVDVRVIAATHRDLESLVRKGAFREDLFYRLQVVPVRIAPLRERREDVIALARNFLRQLTPPDHEPPVLSPDAISTLLSHAWPGNVRELRNVIERSLAFSPVPSVLDSQHLRILGSAA